MTITRESMIGLTIARIRAAERELDEGKDVSIIGYRALVDVLIDLVEREHDETR